MQPGAWVIAFHAERRGGRFRIAPIAGHHQRALDQDFAIGGDAAFNAFQQHADAFVPIGPGKVHAHHRPGFGLPIALQHRQPKRDEKRRQVRIKPRTARDQSAQRAAETRAHFLAHQLFQKRILDAANHAKRGTSHALLPAQQGAIK